MIANLSRLIQRRRPLWEEYEDLLRRLEDDMTTRLSLEEVQRLRFLHESVAGDLSRIQSMAAEPATVSQLEALLARGFGFVHAGRTRKKRPTVNSAAAAFARTVRKNRVMLYVVLATFFLGGVLGGGLVAIDSGVKEVILPFPHLLGDPSDRVAEEESDLSAVDGNESTFAGQLMANNIRVSILAMALGILGGVFTLIVVFYNGVILGAVVVDYILAGESVFLTAWLLPHGSVEIPAILFGAQAGLVIARALLLREKRLSLTSRLRLAQKDIVVLIGGVVVLLIWAGIIEAFFSQYHEPYLPYWVKITFGVVQLGGLIAWLVFVGRREEEPEP